MRVQVFQDKYVVMKMQNFNKIKAKEEDISQLQKITNKGVTPQLRETAK